MKTSYAYLSLMMILTMISCSQKVHDNGVSVNVYRPPLLKTSNLNDYLNKTVLIQDTVYDYKVINKNTSKLFIGLSSKNQKITILLKGLKLSQDLSHSLKKEIMVYGLLVRKNNELEMEVSSKDQIMNYQL